MTVTKKRIAVSVAAVICLLLVTLAMRGPEQPKLIVPLADGTRFVFEGTDSGRVFCFGGRPLQRMLSKMLGRDLPNFVPWLPFVISPYYTNSMALFLIRNHASNLPLWTNWNGSGCLYFRDDAVERPALQRLVCMEVRDTGPSTGKVSGEEIIWEFPKLRAPELHLSIWETNRATGLVTNHDFTLHNPAPK